MLYAYPWAITSVVWLAHKRVDGLLPDISIMAVLMPRPWPCRRASMPTPAGLVALSAILANSNTKMVYNWLMEITNIRIPHPRCRNAWQIRHAPGAASATEYTSMEDFRAYITCSSQ